MERGRAGDIYDISPCTYPSLQLPERFPMGEAPSARIFSSFVCSPQPWPSSEYIEQGQAHRPRTSSAESISGRLRPPMWFVAMRILLQGFGRSFRISLNAFRLAFLHFSFTISDGLASAPGFSTRRPGAIFSDRTPFGAGDLICGVRGGEDVT